MTKVLVALARFSSNQSQKILAKEQERDKNVSIIVAMKCFIFKYVSTR